MYFSDALKVLARQWYVVLAGAAVMLLGGAVVVQFVSTSYQASGQVLLLPPSEPVPDGGRINPYLQLPNGLTLTASLIASAVSTPDEQRAMVADGFLSSYAVSVVPGTGPLIVISVKSTQPLEALATRDELIERISTKLDVIQTAQDVPSRQIIVATTPSGVSSQAEVLAGSKVKALAALIALVSVLTAMLAFGLDRMQSRRRALLAESDGTTDPDDAVEVVPTKRAASGRRARPRSDDGRSDDGTLGEDDAVMAGAAPPATNGSSSDDGSHQQRAESKRRSVTPSRRGR